MTPTNSPLTDPVTSTEVTETPVPDTPAAPDPAPPASPQEPDPAPPTSQQPPEPPALTLWELMRKDAAPTLSDAASRVLSNPRPSIWDID